MGCELAICFSDKLISPKEIAMAMSILVPSCEKLYLVSCVSDTTTPWAEFFAFWVDGFLDLEVVCTLLSEKYSATICTSWKSEHGGIAGYLIFRNGTKFEDVQDSSDDYLFAPARGVEAAFGQALLLDPNELLMFPDVLLDGGEACYLIECSSGSVIAMPPDTVTQLLEDELDVEPVLPFEL